MSKSLHPYLVELDKADLKEFDKKAKANKESRQARIRFLMRADLRGLIKESIIKKMKQTNETKTTK